MKDSKAHPIQALTPVGFEILLSLRTGPLHGYGIMLDIEERTAGEVVLGSGTLYQAIQRLERSGLISEAKVGKKARDARRGRSYRLKPEGRALLDSELRRLCRVVDYARSNRLVPKPDTT